MNLPEDLNQPLYSETGLLLGRTHWLLVRAQNAFENATRVFVPVDQGSGSGFSTSTMKTTEFGEMAGHDEIAWWVRKEEPNLAGLQSATEQTLEAAQVLKERSALLKQRSVDDQYSTLEAWMDQLANFLDQHAEEIRVLHCYVHQLALQNRMAPSVLFNYRIWGSTRMSDRLVQLDVAREAASIEAAREALDLVLGVHFKNFWGVYLDLLDEAFSASDEESGDELVVEPSRFARRSSAASAEACAMYFELIRQALRNVKLEIEKFHEQRGLLTSDSFWRALIRKVAATETSEQQWDVKKTLGMWHGGSDQERERARTKIAKQIASFANAEGGVILVGLDDGRNLVGLSGTASQREHRLRDLEKAIANKCDYSRPFTTVRQVELGGDEGNLVFLAIAVAQTSQAVGVRSGDSLVYPVRRGSGTDYVERLELSSKFHIAKRDNYDFLPGLERFARDRSD